MVEMHKTTTRAEAKANGLVRYYTGKACRHGHTSERFTSTGQCLVCVKEFNSDWRSNNPVKVAQAVERWKSKQANKQKPEKKPTTSRTSMERNRKYRLKKMGFPNANLDVRCIPIDPAVRWSIYYEENKNDISATQLNYRAKNKEALKQAWKDWYTKNRVSQIERCAMRRSVVLQATPKWLSDDERAEITEIYFQSIRLSKETGIEHHVDHEIPLRGKTVCGLHVPWNLRVLTAEDNLKKGNKLVA